MTFTRTGSRIVGLAVVAVGVVAVAVLIQATWGGGQPPAPVLIGVSNEALAQERIILAAPSPESLAQVNAEAAIQTALSGEDSGATVRQTLLADVELTQIIPPRRGLMWITSFEPSTYPFPVEGPANPDEASYTTRYALAFIDALTGEFIWRTAVADPAAD
jgi:hypothetical protein